MKAAMLYSREKRGMVSCNLCAHRCRIAPSKFGLCGVRQNVDGTLHTLVYGEAIASDVDPIEKKPLYHFLPGTKSYSVATIGCNFRCGFCQNWRISQATGKDSSGRLGYPLMPEEIVKEAKAANCRSIAYTYTEPTIFFEYAYDTSRLAQKEGLLNLFVTNGYMTKEALDIIAPHLAGANVDLKSFRDDYYKKHCGAHLEPVLDAIRHMKALDIWVEITTLIIPGENSSEEELDEIAQFIVSVGREIPWHITRFHPDYQYMDYSATPIDTLRRAQEIGKRRGLRYVYLGNVLEDSHTYCYHCGELLVKRGYFHAEECLVKEGKCPSCGTDIDGVWG
ncbi:MAG: radical SAM protein [Latescibacteria bacterium DG_63]|nr:MAG: radical SAM protein [Latescibacteria bacterium DG_63]